MSDRELLELAAKAVGIKGQFENNGEKAGLQLYWPKNPGMWKRWHPLEDDGDALRLAVRLGILELAAAEVNLSCNKVGDEYANTRRSIVRAAAEIGKSMPSNFPTDALKPA